MTQPRNVDVHLVVSYSPVTRRFTFERPLGAIVFPDGQVFDYADRKYHPNFEDDNGDLIIDAGDQLESALRVINTVPSAA